jgi:hypothetical protein
MGHSYRAGVGRIDREIETAAEQSHQWERTLSFTRRAPDRGRGAASQEPPAFPGGTRLEVGFLLGVVGDRCGGGAEVGVSAGGAGFGRGRPANPNRSPQTGSSSPAEGDGGGCDGLGMAPSSGDPPL